MLKVQVDTCKNHLENILDKESMEECISFHQEEEGVQTSIYLRVLEIKIREIVP